jgi:predicted acyl esterase
LILDESGTKMSKSWHELISQPEYGIKTEKNVFVPARDGVRLAVNVYRPDAPGKFPALLAIGGYGKELQELYISPQPLNKSALWDGNIEAGDTTEIVPRGYVHVIADMRGIGDSEGEYPGMGSQEEGKDGADIIEWIATQSWCDGNVGMVGYSYYGNMQLRVAIHKPPHLKSIIVSHVSPDAYRAAYSGGVLSLFHYGLWDGRHGTSGFAPRNAPSQMEKTLSKEEFERRRQELLDHPDIKHYPNVYHLLKYPYKNSNFFDYLMNPFDGPFWRERSTYPYFNRIKIPTYIIGKIGGAQGYWGVYNGIDTIKRLFVKPTGPEERPWREDIELIIRWHDHWLKGNDTGIMDEPPIKMWVPGANLYRYEKEWPLKGIEYTDCYLRRWEGLSFEPELYQPEPDCYLQQPLYLSTKRDSVKYVSPPLPSDVEMIGPAALHMFASIDQDDTNWIVKLSDVAPTGAERPVSRGWLKASHRATDKNRSKPYAPYHPHTSADPVKPGEINEYSIGLGNVINVFHAGHRIKLEIESMESPRDPEIQIHYHPHLPMSRTTLHKIYRNREYQSHLVLPIISGKEAVLEVMSDENFQGGV